MQDWKFLRFQECIVYSVLVEKVPMYVTFQMTKMSTVGSCWHYGVQIAEWHLLMNFDTGREIFFPMFLCPEYADSEEGDT